MKHYKKFYEIGNNRYYTIVADDEMYLANESFLNLGKKKLFRKQKDLVTGFKVLKFSAPIAILFNTLNNLKPDEKQRYDSDDLTTYGHIDNKELREKIRNSYLESINQEIERAERDMKDYLENDKIKLAQHCEKYINDLRKLNPMEGIDLKGTNLKSPIIKSMLNDGLELLFSERVNAFTKNVYLYDQDEFGNLTIYKLITVKSVVKTIDTFIYDKKLVECLLKTLYEEGR